MPLPGASSPESQPRPRRLTARGIYLSPPFSHFLSHLRARLWTQAFMLNLGPQSNAALFRCSHCPSSGRRELSVGSCLPLTVFRCRMILETEVWALGVPAFSSQQTELGNPCVYTSLCTHTCLRFCICSSIQLDVASSHASCLSAPSPPAPSSLPCWSLPPSQTARSLPPAVLHAFAHLFHPVFMYSGFRVVPPWRAT